MRSARVVDVYDFRGYSVGYVSYFVSGRYFSKGRLEYPRRLIKELPIYVVITLNKVNERVGH